MNFPKIITLALVSGVSLSASAAVELVADSGLDLLVINGEKARVESSLFSSTQKATLPDGENQIAFRYTYAFSRGDNFESVETQVIVAKFEASNTSLQFTVPELRNKREAEKQIGSLGWSLVDTSAGKAIPVSEDRLIKNGLQLGRDIVRETQEYNLTGGPAAVAVASAGFSQKATTLPGPKADFVAKTGNTDSTAEEMLHFWYNKADEQTRARFKEYINQQ